MLQDLVGESDYTLDSFASMDTTSWTNSAPHTSNMPSSMGLKPTKLNEGERDGDNVDGEVRRDATATDLQQGSTAAEVPLPPVVQYLPPHVVDIARQLAVPSEASQVTRLNGSIDLLRNLGPSREEITQ